MAPYFRPETPLRSARIRSARKVVNDNTRSNILGVHPADWSDGILLPVPGRTPGACAVEILAVLKACVL
jgi:hypothetical protein